MRQITLALCGVLWATGAAAGLEICNQTDQRHSVAIGYKDGDDWVSEGWWNIDAGACREVVKGDLKNRYYYYRAEAKGRNFDDGGYFFCTIDDEFTIRGADDCAARGQNRVPFALIDTGTTATSYSISMIDAGKSEDARAQEQASAPAQNAEPAREPELFTVRGVFQECGASDDRGGCAFHADGYKWYVWEGAGTPDGVMDQFYNLNTGDMIEVSGDMLEFNDTTVEVIAHQVYPDTIRDEIANTTAGIQGRWVDVDDRSSEIQLYGGEWYDFLDGAYLGESYWRVANSCEESRGSGPVILRRSLEYPDTYDCYLITGWDAIVLQVTYLGEARQPSYTYERVYN